MTRITLIRRNLNRTNDKSISMRFCEFFAFSFSQLIWVKLNDPFTYVAGTHCFPFWLCFSKNVKLRRRLLQKVPCQTVSIMILRYFLVSSHFFLKELCTRWIALGALRHLNSNIDHCYCQAFVQHQERDRKPFLANDSEVDNLVSVFHFLFCFVIHFLIFISNSKTWLRIHFFADDKSDTSS